MVDEFDLDEILARNPQVDRGQLEEARKLLRRLHERGVQRKGYDLAPPFGRRRASARDDARTEPRVLPARRSRGRA